MIQSLAVRLQCLALSANKSAVSAGAIGTLQSFKEQKNIHTSVLLQKKREPTGFISHNDKFYPIQKPDEERRPAFVCHQKCHVRYTPKKMLYVAWLVRGLTVDEAIKQLSFCPKKGAAIVKETILEAQKMAVEKHNVEFKSNLWVAESFCTKGMTIKGVRRHARMRSGEVRYVYCHYRVRLEEGTPPKDYYKRGEGKSSEELLEDWKNKLRSRKIPHSL